MILIVIGTLGTVTKGLVQGLKDLEIRRQVETASLRLARILRRVLETWGDLLSLKTTVEYHQWMLVWKALKWVKKKKKIKNKIIIIIIIIILLHPLIWFQVFLSKTNDLQEYLVTPILSE